MSNFDIKIQTHIETAMMETIKDLASDKGLTVATWLRQLIIKELEDENYSVEYRLMELERRVGELEVKGER